jgi:hypothetical protein
MGEGGIEKILVVNDNPTRQTSHVHTHAHTGESLYATASQMLLWHANKVNTNL